MVTSAVPLYSEPVHTSIEREAGMYRSTSAIVWAANLANGSVGDSQTFM